MAIAPNIRATTVMISAMRARGRSFSRLNSRMTAAMVMPAKLTPTKYTTKVMYNPQVAPPIVPTLRRPVTVMPSLNSRM